MAAIPANFGTGHANLVPSGAQGKPTLAGALRDIADDLAAGRLATIATAITSPDATDLASALLLVNEIKTKLNAGRTAQVGAGALKTTKA